MLNLLLLGHLRALAKELAEAGRKSLKRISLHLAVGGFGFAVAARSNFDVDDGGGDSGRNCFHGTVECGESFYAVVVHGGSGMYIAVAHEESCTEGEGCNNRGWCSHLLRNWY
jgi:hypothetical protein